MQSELGDRFMSIGALKSALELYERLEMWDEVVRCWMGMGKRRQAEGVVREEIAREEKKGMKGMGVGKGRGREGERRG